MPSLFPGQVIDRFTPEARPSARAADTRQAHEQVLLRRARHLDEADRRLLRLALKYRLTVREIAPLLGCNHGSVVRRIRRLRERLCDPLVVALLDPSCPLSKLDRELALAHFLRRQPIRSLAREFDLPGIAVRKRLGYVHGWVTGRREGARVTRAVLQDR